MKNNKLIRDREERALIQKDIENTPGELRADSEELLNRCQAEVFKEYLPYVSSAYHVCEIEDDYSPAESVAAFDITKLVLEKDDKVIEKLKNVYYLLANSGDSVALVLTRKHKTSRLSLAVGIREKNSESVKNLATSLRDGILGNFPGSECSSVSHYSDENGAVFQPLNINGYFGDTNFSSVGIVSNIATDFSEEFAAQGIEKLIDGIRPWEGREYTLVILGQSVSGTDLELKKNSLYKVYSAMSPFAKIQRNWGVNEGKNWSKSWNINLFGNAGLGQHFLPIGAAGTAVQSILALTPGLGGSLGGGQSWGESVGLNKGQSVDITNYGISHTLEVIDQQMKRLEQCEALGLWNFAGYVFSSDFDLVNEVSRMYMSLTQGKESFFERPSVNIWNAQSKGGANRGEINKIRSYVTHLQHPIFEKDDEKASEYFNGENWPDEILCTTGISGAELARSLNLPRSSVPGFAVIECAPFGREIVSYDRQHKGDIRIGRIHHMHHDEELPVELSGDSLTSHVFVTGSTGSGKSNTVYRLLDEANKNFLVIEPTKGEYRYVFGKDVNKFGTNPRLGELLRLNPFTFPKRIHVYEHIDRILEVFNVCWPMYAAMPAVLKDAIIRAYEKVGWDLRSSINRRGDYYPNFGDVCEEIDNVILTSDYSDENKGDYRGALKTRLNSLTNGINQMIFCEGSIPDEVLFDSKTIVDLSRIGSAENKSLIMGVLVIKLQEHRMCRKEGTTNESLSHITVLEEAHHLLKGVNPSASKEEGGGMAAKSVEMLSNAIAEMRTYGEAFVIVDQAPGLLDMSVIRNTNTKIIMRLPDQSDRERVGKAANLNENQIQELAKLQRGVAAIYQNEWIEPVLCHVDRHEITNDDDEAEPLGYVAGQATLSSEEMKYVNSCVYDPNYLPRKSEINFIECVDKLVISDSLKALLVDYASSPVSRRKDLYAEAAYRYFEIEKYMEAQNENEGLSEWSSGLREYLLKDREFMDDTDFTSLTGPRYIFTQMMINQYIERQSRILGPEKIDKVDTMLGYMEELRELRLK